MNKEEIKKRVSLLKVEAETLNTMLENFETQLAEAEKLEKLDKFLEKPKLRHGDYGYCDEPCYPRIVLDEDKLANGSRIFDRNETDEPTVILDNVFDLMKGWDKPFRMVYVNSLVIEYSSKSDKAIFINSAHEHFTISEAEEIWHELGHAIADLKRKQMNKEISGKK